MTCGSLWPVGVFSQSMTCPRLNGLFGQIYDMWLTVNLFYNHTKVWRVTRCDIVFYLYICMTHGSLWALGVYLKQYKIGLFFKTMSSSQGVQSGVQSPRKTSPLHVISPDFNTYKTPPPQPNLTRLDSHHCSLFGQIYDMWITLWSHISLYEKLFGTFWYFLALFFYVCCSTFWDFLTFLGLAISGSL